MTLESRSVTFITISADLDFRSLAALPPAVDSPSNDKGVA
jgi:hypothetical protein